MILDFFRRLMRFRTRRRLRIKIKSFGLSRSKDKEDIVVLQFGILFCLVFMLDLSVNHRADNVEEGK